MKAVPINRRVADNQEPVAGAVDQNFNDKMSGKRTNLLVIPFLACSYNICDSNLTHRPTFSSVQMACQVSKGKRSCPNVVNNKGCIEKGHWE